MVEEVTVEQGQCVKDLALQYYGTVEGMMDIARLNNISMTENILPGQTLKVDKQDNDVVRYLESGKHIPANNDSSLFEGINYWEIEEDFIVQ